MPLLEVETEVLRKIIEFATLQVESPLPPIEKPLVSSDITKVVPERFAAFVDGMEQDLLFRVIKAADKLIIKPLLELACAKAAAVIRGKTPEQIRRMYSIRNDFTPEEEAQIIEENTWAEEA